MVPARHRMHRSADFSIVVRDGARARSGCLIVHQRSSVGSGQSLVGLIVSKAVGGSVVRHRVSRQLRAQLADRLPLLPTNSGTVVRALPAAAHATSTALGADLDRALHRLTAQR